MDDGTLRGLPFCVIEDFKYLIDQCRHLGLNINPLKCELFFCSSFKKDIYLLFDNICPGIKVVTKNLNLLGAPLVEEATLPILERKLDSMRLMFERLKLLNSHTAYYLLRHCLLIPKLKYILRTMPSYNFEMVLERFDENIH